MQILPRLVSALSITSSCKSEALCMISQAVNIFITSLLISRFKLFKYNITSLERMNLEPVDIKSYKILSKKELLKLDFISFFIILNSFVIINVILLF